MYLKTLYTASKRLKKFSEEAFYVLISMVTVQIISLQECSFVENDQSSICIFELFGQTKQYRKRIEMYNLLLGWSVSHLVSLTSCNIGFLVACTRLYTLLCRLVGPSVHPKSLHSASLFSVFLAERRLDLSYCPFPTTILPTRTRLMLSFLRPC